MTERNVVIEIRGLGVLAQGRSLLSGVNLLIPERGVFGIIGPSGAGKSTLLRCLNRLVELDGNLRVEGEVLLHGASIATQNVDALRARVGMLFQQPVVFPASILKNVLFGVRHLGRVSRRDYPEVAERALRDAALWDEVKDRLHAPAGRLSIGQQQRLCLARTLAVEPEVILMDEPTSALDPRSSAAIEELMLRLRARHTIVLVTHHVMQARRVCDHIAFIDAQPDGVGRVVCHGPTQGMLDRTDIPELQDYLRGTLPAVPINGDATQ